MWTGDAIICAPHWSATALRSLFGHHTCGYLCAGTDVMRDKLSLMHHRHSLEHSPKVCAAAACCVVSLAVALSVSTHDLQHVMTI